jgi:LacI family transcriptional regulator
MEQRGTPFVLIDRYIAGLKASYVGVDDEQIGYLATRHLIELGRKRIAHIGGPNVSTAEGRLRGYSKALKEKELEVPMHFVERVESGDDRGEEGGYKAMLALLSMKTRPDGVFCYNDETAIGALRAAFEVGLDVPNDLAIIGVGNMRFSDLLRVPLSSIDQNNQLIGDRAARIALDLIEAKGSAAPESVLLPVELIQRESSAG